MKDYVTPPQECPFCGHKITRAMDLWETPPGPPQPGDLTVCLKCEATLVWSPAMRLQLFDETNVDPEIKTQLAYMRRLLSQMKSKEKETYE